MNFRSTLIFSLIGISVAVINLAGELIASSTLTVIVLAVLKQQVRCTAKLH